MTNHQLVPISLLQPQRARETKSERASACMIGCTLLEIEAIDRKPFRTLQQLLPHCDRTHYEVPDCRHYLVLKKVALMRYLSLNGPLMIGLHQDRSLEFPIGMTEYALLTTSHVAPISVDWMHSSGLVSSGLVSSRLVSSLDAHTICRCE
jgi:hypothetical protein